jgi:hypothetical protein
MKLLFLELECSHLPDTGLWQLSLKYPVGTEPVQGAHPSSHTDGLPKTQFLHIEVGLRTFKSVKISIFFYAHSAFSYVIWSTRESKNIWHENSKRIQKTVLRCWHIAATAFATNVFLVGPSIRSGPARLTDVFFSLTTLCLIIYLRSMLWRHVGEWRYSSTNLDFSTRWRWAVIFTNKPL